MKKLFALLIALTFLVVAGCTTTGSSRVKCPSCGYEFETPATS